VIGELHDADAERLEGIDEVKAILDRARSLKMEIDSETVAASGRLHIRSLSNQQEIVALAQQPMPPSQAAQSRSCVLRAAAHGRRECAYATFPTPVEISRILHHQWADGIDDNAAGVKLERVFSVHGAACCVSYA